MMTFCSPPSPAAADTDASSATAEQPPLLHFLNDVKSAPCNSYESPSITGINRLPPRCSRRPYDDDDDDGQRFGGATNKQSLDGVWDFILYPNPSSVPRAAVQPNFQQPLHSLHGCDAKDSTQLHTYFGKSKVPSNFTHDPTNPDIPAKPQYVNVQMPFYGQYPNVPADDNPTGVYRRTFDLPWIGDDTPIQERKRTVLHFGGVESCYYVYLNGRFVGMAKDSRLPSEFDITSTVHPGHNTLAVVVLRWSDGCFLEQQDHWRMAGIHRSVYVYATPRTFIEDVFARAELILPTDHADCPTVKNEALRGRVHLQTRIGSIDMLKERCNNYKEEMKYDGGRFRIVVKLFGPDGKAVMDRPLGADDVEGGIFRSHLTSFALAIPDDHIIHPWTDETPSLYQCVATLVDDKSSEIETISFRLGFRCIEISNRELLLNGRPVLIKGVNRHDHSPTGGKTVSKEEIKTDLRLMKQFNFNAVRCAHYPNSSFFYDLCDELGLLVIDEANIECHSSYDLISREHIFASAFLDRVMRMVVRDQNHACVIGWSLGNEAGYGPNHTMAAGWIRGYDPSRFVHYEGAVHSEWCQGPNDYRRPDGPLATDIVCPMYPTVEEMKEWAEKIAPEIGETRPYIMCEYSHSMGCSGGGLSDYWNLIKKTHGLQGGFVWDWIDQGLLKIDDSGRSFYAYGGDYCDCPNDANFCINGMVASSRKPHPIMQEFKKCAQPVGFASDNPNSGFITVCNWRFFTSLDDLIGTWALRVDGFSIAEGEFDLPDIAPRTSETVQLPISRRLAELPMSALGCKEIHLDLAAWQEEHEVAREQIVVSRGRPLPLPQHYFYNRDISLGSATKKTGNTMILDSGGGLKILFDAKLGGLTQIKSTEGEIILSSGPRPNLFRAGTDNDGVKLWTGQLESKPLGTWLLNGLDNLVLEKPSIREDRADLFGLRDFPIVVTSADVVGCPGATTYPGISMAESLQARKDLPSRIEIGRWTQKVAVLPDEAIYVENEIDIRAQLKDLPRVGIEFTVPAKFRGTSFFSDGPFENYSDRRYAAHAGVWEEAVANVLDEYVVPQEQGNRMNLRWLLFSEGKMAGGVKDSKARNQQELFEEKNGEKLLVEPDGPVEFTVSRYSDNQLFGARHNSEMEPSDVVYVRLDAAQRGLGTGSCGPQTSPQYQLHSGTYRVAFRLVIQR